MTEGQLPPSSKPTPEARPTNYVAAAGKKEVEVPEAERPPLPKLAGTPVKVKKRGIGAKFRDSFAGDDARSVGSYVFFDVFLPGAKNIIFDLVQESAKRLLFGTAAPMSTRSTLSPNRTGYSRVYGSSSTNAPPPPAREISQYARNTHRFDQEIIFGTRGEADATLDDLKAYVDMYNKVTVADLYNALEITANHTDTRHGWYDLTGANIRNVHNGYQLELPPTVPIT